MDMLHEAKESKSARLTMDAPWRWLAEGWNDLARAPALSIGYGVAILAGGALILYALWRTGMSSMIPVAFGVFALVGPILATGLYEISRRLGAGEPLTPSAIVFVKTKSPRQIALIGFFLMFAVLVWLRVAMLLYALFSSASYLPLDDFLAFAISTPEGLSMLVIGALVGGGIAFSIYLLTVVSIPMLMNEETDAFSAIAAGVNAFRAHPATMALWAWLIAIITAAGVATFFVGLAVAFPLLGHASWHAYKEIMGRDD